MLRLSDLRQRDVINVADGRKLGWVDDIEIDEEDGQITALILPGGPRWFGLFGRDREVVVPWDQILRIGEDVILVELTGYPPRGRRGREEG